MLDLIYNKYSGFFSKGQLEHILSHFTPVKLNKGKLLHCQDSGSELDGVSLLKTGLLEYEFTLSTGNPISLGQIGPGSFTGTITLFDKMPHPYSILCREESEIYQISRAGFNNLFKKQSREGFFFRKILLITLAMELRSINSQFHIFFKKDQAEEDTMVRNRLKLRPHINDEGHSHQEKFFSLKELNVFSRLDDSEIELLTTLSSSMVFEKDQLIFREGAKGSSVFFILEGEVRISKFFSGVGEEALVVLKKGDFFGEMAFLDGSPRSAYAISNTRTKVFSVSSQALEGLFTLNLKDAIKILNIFGYILSGRCRKTINTIEFFKILEGNF